jgi:hypothetical protein
MFTNSVKTPFTDLVKIHATDSSKKSSKSVYQISEFTHKKHRQRESKILCEKFSPIKSIPILPFNRTLIDF